MKVFTIAFFCTWFVIAERSEDGPFEMKTDRSGDQIEILPESAKSMFTQNFFRVTSERGIGSGVVRRTSKTWPGSITIRLHLQGLESFTLSSGNKALRISVSSTTKGVRPMIHEIVMGKEGKRLDKMSPLWVDVLAFDKSGKVLGDRPSKGGYFQLTVPEALLAEESSELKLRWIDFYRN